MKYDINPVSCRICLRKSSSCRSIFKPLDVRDIAPNVKLNLVSGVNVNQKDDNQGLPQLICKQCEISVNMAFNLRNRARKSDQILSVYCNKRNKDNIILELENGRKFKLSKELTLKVVPTNELLPATLSSISLPPESHILKTILIEDSDNDEGNDGNGIENNGIDGDGIDDDGNKDDNSDNYENDRKEVENEFESDFSSNERYISKTKIEDSLKINASENNKTKFTCNPDFGMAELQPVYNGEEIANQLKASDQYELLSWNQEGDSNVVPTFRLRLKGTMEKSASKDFICDVCGNTYNQKHRLMDHMRRHNKEKSFSCEICGKCFVVAEGLRRHVLTHGAQKPFECNYCTRCFYTPSARKAHERVHSGAKPFVCSICTKAFAYTCSLRKHMLIHENKKLYRCEYCDKQFRLQHHMKQHEETQIHKDTVSECVRLMEKDKVVKTKSESI